MSRVFTIDVYQVHDLLVFFWAAAVYNNSLYFSRSSSWFHKSLIWPCNPVWNLYLIINFFYLSVNWYGLFNTIDNFNICFVIRLNMYKTSATLPAWIHAPQQNLHSNRYSFSLQNNF